MSAFVDNICRYVKRVDEDEQLRGILIENRDQSPRRRPNYFFLTDLVNPQQAYWAHIGELPEITDEQEELFAHGNRMERLAKVAFSEIDGFLPAEGVLDGAANGLPGIRGRVDFRYQQSLVEFKTSPYDIESSDDIWSYVPQNAEQLLFYTALWTYSYPEHYLIYHLGDEPSSIRAFSVQIEDPGLIRNQLKSRKTNLERAIEIEDPSLVHQCRYFDTTCHIDNGGLCNCDEMDPINHEPLQRASDITRDHEFEEKLIEAFSEIQNRPRELGPWDLVTPRQWYLRENDLQTRDGDYLRPVWVRDALRNADVTPGIFEDVYPPRLQEPLPFGPRVTMIKDERSRGTDTTTKWVPALLRANKSGNPLTHENIKNQVMQLACACAFDNSTTGYLIYELPNSTVEIQVFRIIFDQVSEIENLIIDRLGEIKDGLRSNDPSELPECPRWIQSYDCENCVCES